MKYRLLHASGPHPIPPPDDPNGIGTKFTCSKSAMATERLITESSKSTTLANAFNDKGHKNGTNRVKVRHLSCRVSMTFRVKRTNMYNQDLGLNPLDQ
ncbi:hypothetical protein F511_32286 [Dorcoceras hygrometricum]|uniref:Uncharacterized protein n=1 Tax=Dorcoceras hygrometricum TaxID=472368 RepID=A0A2Z7A4J9_9LAMI|nr:hypothetical protein F511_32286 [Dorcoceras hygrometricum]